MNTTARNLNPDDVSDKAATPVTAPSTGQVSRLTEAKAALPLLPVAIYATPTAMSVKAVMKMIA